MKLIIKEYLSKLKESAELDKLLPDLLLSMGIEPISRAQIGVRQHGVDVAAVGKIDKGKKTLYLFTIKQGDVNRNDWDSNSQSVRPSLNDIRDVYLKTCVSDEHKALPIKIILCTGGIIKQEVQPNWIGYSDDNKVPDKREYEFWGGDKLAILIEEFMFSENILPEEFRSLFRRTLSLISDMDYDLSDYTLILKQMLLEKDFGDIKKPAFQKKIKKNLLSIHLCMNIIWVWSKQEKNLKNSLIAAERTVLFTWQFLQKSQLIDNKSILIIYLSIQNTLLKIYNDYTIKIHKHCSVENGLLGYNSHYILGVLTVFEQLGIVSILGIEYKLTGNILNNIELQRSARDICDLIKELITNHEATKSPLYDNHSIEISEGILLLAMFSEFDFIENWISDIVKNIEFAYSNLNKYFPISSDSFDDLISLNINQTENKSDFINISTLIPILAQWCATLNLTKPYDLILNLVKEVIPETTLQIWYPDIETDNYIYCCNAALKSGAVDAPFIIPATIDEMKDQIIKVQKNTIEFNKLSSVNHSLLALPIISSRHFRTPFLPQYIQLSIVNNNNNQLEI
jgi:hypothetical protein